MNKLVSLLLLLAAFLPGKQGWAQSSRLPIGSWQLHVPHNRAIALAQAGNFIYTATEDGFFRLDQEYKQVQVLSKTDGFNGGKISTLDYDPASATLVVAYDNTHIDLVQANHIIPI